LGSAIRGTCNAALFKEDRLEVMRIILLSGESMPTHAVDGPITVQCIEGTIRIIAGTANRQLCTGDLLYLTGEVAHELHALSDFVNPADHRVGEGIETTWARCKPTPSSR